jgi:hypothetical protein
VTTATIRKTVNVVSFNKMYLVEMHVYNVKSANSIQECKNGVYIQRNTIVFCPLTNWSTPINKAGFLATNILHMDKKKIHTPIILQKTFKCPGKVPGQLIPNMTCS